MPNNRFLPQTQGLTPPRLGNPGSATALTSPGSTPTPPRCVIGTYVSQLLRIDLFSQQQQTRKAHPAPYTDMFVNWSS